MTQPAEEGQTADTELEEPEDIAALQAALTEEKEKAERYLANWQRAEADLANYKRRSDLEKAEIGKFANTSLILSILSALDDLERAFAHIPPRLAKMEWVEGIRLIERKLVAGLESNGLTRIEALGQPFDPNVHEAVRQGSGEEGIVVEEVQKGFILHDRIIRPAQVVVGNGEAEGA